MADDVLGNRSLDAFEYCIIGSGAGGASAAWVLTAAGQRVLVLEAGGNAFPGLDDPTQLPPPLHSNDELKYAVRGWIDHDPFLEPRTYRQRATDAQGQPVDGALERDVNVLPKAVGGAFQHADAKLPRFNAVDFRLRSAMEHLLGTTPGLAVPGFGADAASANFADWPFGYEDLEPFYVEAEQLYGVQGLAGANPYESRRSRPYPMPPGVPMYIAVVLVDAASRTVLAGSGPLRPHPYPAAIASRPYGTGPDARPPCVDCGLCSGFGCPNHAKGSPAVTALRRALLTGRCQVRYNAHVTRLMNTGSHVTSVEYVDATGTVQAAQADRYLLAASAIESARLCLLSRTPGDSALGNSSGQVGQNLMFHLQTNVNGFLPQRTHGQRGRAVTHGISDLRGVLPGGDEIRVLPDGAGNKTIAMGGICEFSASQGLPITEDGNTYALSPLAAVAGARWGRKLRTLMRELPLGQHLIGLIMQAEDAPQRTNCVDLDARYRDVFGQPVARITYDNHPYEKSARRFYIPLLKEIVGKAGASQVFVTPTDPALVGPPSTRHLMGTLRMGSDAATSVLDPAGRFWDVDNLYACDGSVFPTSSGYNPTLTIIAVALRIAHGLAGTAPVIT
jgi:choline dehydrogenase-like flavoprotein